MEVKILNESNDELEVELESITLAEIIRVYLNKDSSVVFAAWKREHPTKNPILAVKGKNPKKLIKDAINSVVKDLDKVEKDFEKMK